MTGHGGKSSLSTQEVRHVDTKYYYQGQESNKLGQIVEIGLVGGGGGVGVSALDPPSPP